MSIPVFLSCPKPYLQRQVDFLNAVEAHLGECDLRPMTLGRSEYSMDAPLIAIRRLMGSSFGLLTLAFRRTLIDSGFDRPSSDVGEKQISRADTWLTSPYCQIEPAMAYQIGLPVLVWREAGVTEEGLLDRGALDLAMPSFDLDAPPRLSEREWKQPLSEWVRRVQSTYARNGEPVRRWQP